MAILNSMGKSRAKPRSHVTVKSIADYAGVSIGSVSSVLNNHHVERRISLETVEKVRAAAAKLGYLPNISARRLRSKTGTKHNIVIAFITSYEAPLGIVNQFLSALRHAVANGTGFARDVSFSLLIEMFSAGRLREMPGLLTGDYFNAALIANTTPEDDQFLQRAHLPYPVVLVNRVIPGYSSVVEDPQSGAYSAEVLVKAKRKNLAVLHGSPLTQTTRTRVDSFVTQVTRLLGRTPSELVAETLSEEGGYQAMSRFLARGGELDGLYAATDSMALGAYHALKREGLQIPRDVAVIGVGDYEITPFFDPPLSVIGVSRQQIGDEASELLLRQLNGSSRQPEQIAIPVQTTLRESTAAR